MNKFKMKMTATLMTTLFLASITAIAIPVNAATWDVYPGPGTPIQDAITAASAGDTIIVYPGTYNEMVTVSKDVTIRGLGFPTINGQPIGFYVTADGATVERFDIQVPNGIGILVAVNHVTISHNKIAGGGAGTPTNYEAGIYVIANVIIANFLSRSGPMCSKWPADELTGLTIDLNTITMTTGPGIVLNHVADSIVSRNQIYDIAGDGIQLLSTYGVGSHDNFIERNTIQKVGGNGIKVVNSYDNTVQRNRVMDSVYDGIFVMEWWPSPPLPLAPGPLTYGNIIQRNVMLRNGGFDAHDTTSGTGTAGTANTWTRNVFRTSSPTSLE